MKHMNCIGPALLVLAARVALGGCNAGGSSSSGGSTTASSTTAATAATTASTTTATTATSVPTIPLPGPVTGTYNGQTITMRYKAITNYIWPNDNLRPTYFINGFAPFYYYGSVPEEERLVGGSFLDKTGRMILDPIYATVTPFDADGRALVSKVDDGPFISIDVSGTEFGVCDDPVFAWPKESKDADGFVGDYMVSEQEDGKFAIIDRNKKTVATLPDGLQNAYIATDGLVVCTFGDMEVNGPAGKYTQVYDTSGRLLNETKFERIGSYEDGLAPFLIDGKLGLIDHKGNIVIPATYAVDTFFADDFVLSEGLLLVNTSGRISIIEVMRSES